MERRDEQVSSGRLLLRFVVGAAEVTGGRLAAALRLFDERRASAGGPVAWPAVAPRHVLLGALFSAPAGLHGALARARPLAEKTTRAAGRGLRAVARLP